MGGRFTTMQCRDFELSRAPQQPDASRARTILFLQQKRGHELGACATNTYWRERMCASYLSRLPRAGDSRVNWKASDALGWRARGHALCSSSQTVSRPHGLVCDKKEGKNRTQGSFTRTAPSGQKSIMHWGGRRRQLHGRRRRRACGRPSSGCRRREGGRRGHQTRRARGSA